MSLEFTCRECRTELRVDDKDVEKKVRCPKCGMIQACPGNRRRKSSEPEITQETEKQQGYDRETAYLPNASITNKQDDPATGNTWLLKTTDNSVYGPVDQATLREWTTQGRVSSQCLVRRVTATHWQSALAQFPDLAHLTPKNVRPLPLENRSNTAEIVQIPSRRNNHAIWILLCALIGLFGGTPLFSLGAVIWGSLELLKIKKGHVKRTNRTMIIWGIVLGSLKLLENIVADLP